MLKKQQQQQKNLILTTKIYKLLGITIQKK